MIKVFKGALKVELSELLLFAYESSGGVRVDDVTHSDFFRF